MSDDKKSGADADPPGAPPLPDPAAPPQDRAVSPLRDRAARVDLSRTWEIELFISGATVFALLQAPGVVDRWYASAAPHLAGGPGMLGFFAYYFAKLILYTLVATFLLHLFARAYWVALVGLHSVFPGGVRWAELNYGPTFVGEFRRRLPSLEQSIRRVDDLSSLLFSGGAVILLMFVAAILVVGPLALLSAAVARLLPGRPDTYLVVMVLVFAIAMIPVVARAVDLRAARRGDPGAGPSGGLRRAAIFSYYLGLTPVVGPLSLVLSTNLGRRSATTATTLVFIGIVGTFLVRDVLLARDTLRLDSHIYLPDAVALQELRPSHYADERTGTDRLDTTPHVQSAVITEPYVRLFIPITPDRHNALIAERCPELPARPGGLRLVSGRTTGGEAPDVQRVIDCVAELQPVSVNGQPLDGLTWRLATDARTGVRGLVSYIPVAGLPSGEHVLRVEGLPRPRNARGASREPPARPPHIIRFWI